MPKHYENVFGWTDFEDVYRQMVNEHNDCLFVEVGSFQGKSAVMMGELIKESGKNLKLVAIDLFPTKDEIDIYASIGVGQGAEREENLKLSKSLLDTFVENTRNAGVEDVIIPIKSDSHKCISLFQDNSIPFVFLDASHQYKTVLEDIKLWWDKISPSGYLGGHDYYNEVSKAVHDFFDPLGIKVERRTSSWLVRKEQGNE